MAFKRFGTVPVKLHNCLVSSLVNVNVNIKLRLLLIAYSFKAWAGIVIGNVALF